MNPRIKELALLSGFDIDTNVSFAEKTRLKCFAKLLVKECVNSIPLDMDPTEYLKVMRAVKNTLGVEE